MLTLDRQVGDFAQADVLIEDGKIREVRPNIEVSADAAAVVDASNRILIPGFVDTHSHSYQGLLRSILANGLLNPDYNRDIQNISDAGLSGRGCLCRGAGDGARLHRHGHDRDRRYLAGFSHTPEHSDACIRALQESGIRAVYAYSPRRRPRLAISARHQAAAADLFQLQGSAADARA